MKILVLAALIAAATSGRLGDEVQTQGPWRVGTQYKYSVDSYTLARLSEGASSGTAFQAQFVVRAARPGFLLARLENPRHAQVHQELPGNRQLPADLKYDPVPKLDQPFEISIDGGRVVALSLPSTLSLAHENLLKGLISALQLDLSTHRHVRRDDNGYDQQAKQGMFRKMETDVTGDCETLYNVYPAVPEWRRELPHFAQEEEPIMISKTKDYGHCHHRVAYHFGVPHGSEWSGIARRNENQFIRRATVSRILAGRQGPIYKSETTSTVHVNPQVYGQEKAEVLSYVQLTLQSYEEDSQSEWQMPQNNRPVKNLLYSITQKQVNIRDWDSSSESGEESENQLVMQQGKNRMPRSVKTVAQQLNQQIDETVDLPQISIEDHSGLTFVNDDMPKNNEPAYAAMYLTPQARVDKKQNPVNAKKLVQELAKQLQNPNEMPQGDFLTKFNVLVRIIASMSSEQLGVTSRGLEVGKTSDYKVKADMWMIYRDAVTQAGTLPAFQQIKTWILSKKIQGEEAAQVLVSLVNTIRYPTKDIMIQFFKLALSDEVKQQKYLNSTALIAATRFINMGQVNNETAYSYYPSHMYGRLSRQQDTFVVEEVLPRLSEGLKEAVQIGDSSVAQVYIKAIGNLGHRGVLDVFAPYLEGKIPVSTYLRTQMVKNLQVLAHQRDHYARAVLFSILRNIAEPYEVRVAAISNIFMARPNTAMMQAMAQMTHNDPSVEIRAVLKSSIETAAELKNLHYLDLARTAQAAKWMLTKQQYGKQYSNKYLNDFKDDESELSILSAFSQIGSKDSLFPKSLKYSIKSKSGGWDKEQTISTSFSSVQQIVDALQQQMSMIWKQQPRSQAQHKFSAEKISEMLNIRRQPQEPLEAALLVAIMGQERYFSFSENDIKELPSAIKQYLSDLAKGTEEHYTKVLNQEQISIMFPVGMGMPFIYKYKTPTIVHFQAKAKGQVNPQAIGGSADISSEVQFTYARNIDGSVGFMDTLSNQYASVGVVSKFQLNVPFKMQLLAKSGEMKIQVEPLRADQDNTIVHYSVWPYSANQKKDSLVPVGLEKTTKVINRDNKVVAINTKFGQSVGTLFQLEGYSYSSDYRNPGEMLSQDLITNIANALYQKDVALTHFNLRHLGKSSQNNRISFKVSLDTLYNQKHASQPLVASDMAEVAPNSEIRRKEMAKRAGAGINTARVQILDMSATFDGKQKREFVLTAAMADSKVDNRIQYAFFAGRNSVLEKENAQINGVASVTKPMVTSLNFLEALEKEMKMKFNVDIKYGAEEYFRVSGYTERSKKYVEELLKMSQAKKCMKQIAENDFYQLACHEMIVKAHAPDYLKASVTYNKSSRALNWLMFEAIRVAESLGYWYSERTPAQTGVAGKMDVELRMSYLENTASVVVDWMMGGVRFNKVPIPVYAPEALAIYVPFSAQERVYNFFTRAQYQPFCTVDGNSIKTFSNRQYQYPLTRSWHVVMQDDGSRLNKDRDQLVVLARRTGEKQQEIYISYKSRSGKDLELEIQPAAQPKGKPILKLKTNGNKLTEGDVTMYWDEITEQPLLQFYMLPEGVLMVNIHEGRLRAMYDGSRLVVLARETRQNIRGICGYMNGEARYDYLTPTGLVDKPEHYGASFALNEGESDPKTLELKTQAQKLSYPTKNQYTAILPADEQWKKVRQSSEEDETMRGVYRARSYLKSQGECQIEEQIQYYEDHGEICVSVEAVPACQSRCRGEGYQIKEVQVICRPKNDQQFRVYKEQIRRGENPKMVGSSQKTKRFRVPNTCRA